jgi:transposase-like protein
MPKISRRNWTSGAKIKAVKYYLEEKAKTIARGHLHGTRGDKGYATIAREINCDRGTLYRWVRLYKKEGEKGLTRRKKRRIPYKRTRIEKVLARQPLSPRDIATIRYGMAGLSQRQIAAYFGKSQPYIKKILEGKAGGRIVAPLSTPATRTKAEADLWFVQRVTQDLEAYTKILERLHAEGDKAQIYDLMEGRLEPKARKPPSTLGIARKRRNNETPNASPAPTPEGDGRPGQSDIIGVPPTLPDRPRKPDPPADQRGEGWITERRRP